jgi:hypothetical protein
VEKVKKEKARREGEYSWLDIHIAAQSKGWNDEDDKLVIPPKKGSTAGQASSGTLPSVSWSRVRRRRMNIPGEHREIRNPGVPCFRSFLVMCDTKQRLPEFRHHLFGKQLQSLAGAGDVPRARVEVKGYVLNALLLPHLGQPSAAITWGANDSTLLYMLCHPCGNDGNLVL